MASDWKLSTLEEAGVVLIDCVHKTPPATDQGYPYIGIPQIKNGCIDFSLNPRLISYSDYKKWTIKADPKADDIVLSRRCNPGETAYVPQGVEFALGQNLVLLRSVGDKIHPPFLRWLVRGPEWWAQVGKYLNVGAVFDSLRCGEIPRFELLIPPLSEQKAIAHILGSLDDKIELNRQMNETLEAMAQALFKSWFVDFDPVIDNALAAGNTIPDELLERAEQRKAIEKKDNSDIQSLFPDEFEFTEEMGWIPKGWSVSNVGTEFDVTMGQSPPGSTYNELEEGTYFFQGSTDFGFRYPTPRIYCTEPKRLANKRDTLVSVRAPVGDTNIAAVDCCIGRGLAALRHKSNSASFTYYSMLQLKENFKIYEGEGTVFGSINQKDFKNLTQLKVPEVLVSKFEINAGALDYKIELNSLNIIELTKLRDTLLPKLMSGELRIPDAVALVDDVL